MAVNNKKTFRLSGGYAKAFLLLNRIFNIILASIFLLLSIPIMLVIALVIKLYDGGPLIYASTRLGLHKNPFIMYKFRTLIPGADKIIGPEVLSDTHHQVMTPYGKFLRNTRFDELPQLVNIIKGDMDFFGPRPQPVDLYNNICRNIKGYDRRFSVKPGLIGYPQLFLPHSAPKKMQSRMDNMYILKRQNFLWEFGIILYTMVVSIRISLQKTWEYVTKSLIKSRILKQYSEKRILDRVKIRRATVKIGTIVDGKRHFGDEAQLLDINDRAFLIHTNHRIEQNDNLFCLMTYVKNRGPRTKEKKALCKGEIYKETELKKKRYRYAYVILYKPVSPLNYYMVHQYFLLKSMVR